MKYYVYNHQHKGRPYAIALKEQGWMPNMREPDVALFDRDWYIHNDGLPRKAVVRYYDNGSTVMLYPHSPLPPWWYDGLIKIDKRTSCVFVVGEGQKEVMKVIAPGANVIVSGWPWCNQKTFKPVKFVNRVLFAPIHPSGGKLRPEAYEANQAIFKDLLRMLYDKKIQQLVVRFIGDIQTQGLKQSNKIIWIAGKPDGSTREIDVSDVVIAEGTFMYLAVARGKPTVGINQHLPCRANKQCDKYTPHNWHKYGDDLAYPINYVPGRVEELMKIASQEEQSGWREKLIGQSLESKDFADKVLKAKG
jgi:hypothetical protein